MRMHRAVTFALIVPLVATMTACFEWSSDPCAGSAAAIAPCPPTVTSTPPTPQVEPPLPPGLHPVVVHDCDLESGYSVRERRNRPPDTGRDIDVHAIEVYQTSNGHSFREHPEGAADVYVHATARPQLLVLKSYEPTLWRVYADDGVVIPMVVVDGYHRQRIEGVPIDIEVVTRENWPSIPDRQLAALADQPPASETYCYDASLFSIRP